MEALLHYYLLLSSSAGPVGNLGNEVDPKLVEHSQSILNGESYKVVNKLLQPVVFQIESVSNKEQLLEVLQNVLEKNFMDQSISLILAIALLQTFIQNNFTGPSVPISSHSVIFNFESTNENLQRLLIQLLSPLGQPAYELTDDPVYLVLSLLLLEHITQQPTLFLATGDEVRLPEISAASTTSLTAFAHWWRARALLTQLSLLPEPTGPHPIVASSILSSVDLAHAISNGLPPICTDNMKKNLYTIYYLENTKCSLAINTEQLCLPSLTKVKKLTNFSFVLTGARAMRTKFQQKAHAGLIILAQSAVSPDSSSDDSEYSPESFVLDSDLLLEKPHFESIGDEPLDEQIVKKQKQDDGSGYEENRILPFAIRQENIPVELKGLNPNEQPQLTEYDNIQLLLRLYVIRQTTPAQDPLVEEELSALIGRILYQPGNKNWTIFSRALWERSVVETTKAKTIERGLLQMQSLVEELGLKISAKIIPQAEGQETQSSCGRLKYIHQLPLIPRWALDTKLAEKYMSMGILRSAVEIYERLSMWCEAALCYAAVGDEKQAENILARRIEACPTDARAYSILGDIRQDPDLWLKSWEIGKYVNAKNSLGRYYYNPPPSSGLQRDYMAALKHLNDSLRLYPLSFDTWYFYGCIGLECNKMELAAEAFSRCVSLDETHSLSWSNLSAAYIQLDKVKESFSCLKKAISSDAQNNWRIWENYMLVAVKLNEWDDVLLACKHLVNIRRDKSGEGSIDLPIVEKLAELLVSTDYPSDETQRLSHYQSSCIEFICSTLPSVITTSSRCWKVVGRVELWRKRPWAALECHEKAYRAMSHNPDLEIDERVWNDTVDACQDLVAAYESLGELGGKYGAGDLVCKDWKYKARSTIKSLMSKGKNSWEDSDGWETLLELRKQL